MKFYIVFLLSTLAVSAKASIWNPDPLPPLPPLPPSPMPPMPPTPGPQPMQQCNYCPPGTQVCASDYRTYPSECVMNGVAQLTGTYLRVMYYGQCYGGTGIGSGTPGAGMPGQGIGSGMG